MAQHDQTAILPVLRARIFVYDLLRRTYLEEPSVGYIKLITQPGLIEGFPYTNESPKIARGVHQLAAYLQQNDMADPHVMDRLHWDYTRMFIGPYSLPAPPWESSYKSEHKQLFQEVTLRVRQAYLKYGLLPQHFQQEADDHIGLELDFMYRLAVLTVEKPDQGGQNDIAALLADSRAFLTGHLLQWTPQLVSDILDNAETEYYKGMARILSGFLELDVELLNELTAYFGAPAHA